MCCCCCWLLLLLLLLFLLLLLLLLLLLWLLLLKLPRLDRHPTKGINTANDDSCPGICIRCSSSKMNPKHTGMPKSSPWRRTMVDPANATSTDYIISVSIATLYQTGSRFRQSQGTGCTEVAFSVPLGSTRGHFTPLGVVLLLAQRAEIWARYIAVHCFVLGLELEGVWSTD